jgi:NADH-quinone oxidoreductase subunit K
MFLSFSFNLLFLFSSLIFFFGLLGLILNKRNLLLLLMSIELMLLGVNLNFIIFSVLLDDLMGQIFSLYILTVAAAESAIGLALFSLYFKDKQIIYLEFLFRARG